MYHVHTNPIDRNVTMFSGTTMLCIRQQSRFFSSNPISKAPLFFHRQSVLFGHRPQSDGRKRSSQIPKPHSLSSHPPTYIRVFCTSESQQDLAGKKCVPCSSKDIHPMPQHAARDLLPQVEGWNIQTQDDGNLKLHRSWKVRSFTKGLELFQRVAAVAEEEGHHPDLHLVGWNNVCIEIWTHSVGGLTENDFILAAKISALDMEGLVRRKTKP